MTSRYSAPLPRPVNARTARVGKAAAFGGVALAGIAMLSACSTGPSALETQARAAVVPAAISAQIAGMDFEEDTFELRRDVQDPGTVIVLWGDHSFGGRDGPTAQAVVYSIAADGSLTALRTCPLDHGDVHSGKSHPLRSSVDDETTQIHCETAEEAQAAGRTNPMLILRGRSNDFLPGVGPQNGEVISTGWGVL